MSLVYNDLAHPAPTSISDKYAWRTADGSYNNIDIPDMGKVGMSQLQLSNVSSPVSSGWYTLFPLSSTNPSITPKSTPRPWSSVRYVSL